MTKSLFIIGKRKIIFQIQKGINSLVIWFNSLDNSLRLTIIFSLFLNAFFYFVVWKNCPIRSCPVNLLNFQQSKYRNHHNALPKELNFLSSTALTEYGMAEAMSFDKIIHRKRMRLSHVVMPFHIRQIDKAIKNVQMWIKYPPCAAGSHDNSIAGVNSYYRKVRNLEDPQNLPLGHNVTMIFFLNGKKDRGVIEKLVKSFRELPENVKSCFVEGDPLVRFADLPPNSDDYIRGSRVMFHQVLNGYLGIYEPSYILQMEPDALPIRPHWLAITDSTTRYPNPEFWIKGTAFTGSTKVLRNPNAILNLFHLNGNAIYNLGDHGLRDFYFQQVSAWNFGRMPDVAYDMAIYRYLLHPPNYNFTRHIAHKLQYSKIIQNPWKTEYSLKALWKKYELTCLVHSGTQNT